MCELILYELKITDAAPWMPMGSHGPVAALLSDELPESKAPHLAHCAWGHDCPLVNVKAAGSSLIAIYVGLETNPSIFLMKVHFLRKYCSSFLSYFGGSWDTVCLPSEDSARKDGLGSFSFDLVQSQSVWYPKDTDWLS